VCELHTGVMLVTVFYAVYDCFFVELSSVPGPPNSYSHVTSGQDEWNVVWPRDRYVASLLTMT